MGFDQIRKRDGSVEKFDKSKITEAIWQAAQAVGGTNKDLSRKLSDEAVELLEERIDEDEIPTVEQVQDAVEKTLVENGHYKTGKAYILYRSRHAELRKFHELMSDVSLVENYIKENDWRVKENSNMTFSLQGLNVHVTDRIISKYWLDKIYPPEVRKGHNSGLFHIHDLGTLGAYTYFGKEAVVAKLGGKILNTSFENLYKEIQTEEKLLSAEDGAWAKYPEHMKVLDKDGWTKVTRLVKKSKDKEMRFVKNEGGRSVIVTKDHPILIGNLKTREASKVEEEEDKTLTINPKPLEQENLFSERELFLADKLLERGVDDFWIEGMPFEEWEKFEEDLKVEGIVSTSNNANSLPNRIELTKNLGYLLGFYLAEGSMSTHKIRIKQRDTEESAEIIEKLKEAAWELGCRVYLRKKGDKKVMEIANSTFVKYLLKEVFGANGVSREKHLPKQILSYNKEFVKGVVGGILDGDGSIATSGTSLVIRISSRTMLEQLATLLNLLGFTARDRNLEGQGTTHEFNGKKITQNYPLFGISFRVKEGKELPSIKYNSAKNSQRAWRAEDSGWHKVLNNESTKIQDDYIYDLTTESGTLVVNGMWNHNCVGWDLQDLLLSGFKGVRGKIQSRPANHFDVALLQVVNFLYTLQGEAAGAQALSNFDTLLAPFIRYDDLSYEEVKQSMQKFLYNMNVPTRVGFQCMSEDTEILTPEGWEGYDEVEKGDTIKTFDVEEGIIEDQEVNRVFKRKYEGEMYNLKNRIQDQLISSEHRVVRKKFNSEEYILEPIEEVEELKSPIVVPVAGQNSNDDLEISDEKIKLMAWIIGEGSMGTAGDNYRSCNRVSIYQSAIKNKDNYEEIKELLNHFKLDFSEFTQKGLGDEVQRIRMDAESSKKIHEWFKGKENVGKIPQYFLEMSERQSRLFLDTYIKAEGFEDCKIATSDLDILNKLQAIASNAGYSSTVLERKPTIGTKTVYVLRLVKHKDTYIQEIKKVDYSGIIWCPNTDNETVIARRNGKVFITGNTPFTNLTIDLEVPEYMKDEPVVIGGERKDKTYSEFQEEVDMLNRAFAEVMLEGDAKGRPFTFPIPTYNITPNFDWDNPVLDPVWKMTAKYGIPYFSNFINSDMNPEDARSMCCRLRIDNRELKKRGGGLFGSNPLTGSIGVVTLNLPRIAYLSNSEEEFFEKLVELMERAKKSLTIKRGVLEKFTEKGLYPYSKFYLRSIKESEGEYWKNHFSTIGLIGMNDALLNLKDTNIATEEGRSFAERTLEFMRNKIADFQQETGDIFNLEATPAEGSSYRLARKDRKDFSDIKIYNLEKHKDSEPVYTNSTQLPFGYSNDLFEALNIQDPLQTKYTGGTVFHAWLGEKMPSVEATKKLVKKISESYELPYYTFTPTFSICPKHGYLSGEHKFCPTCRDRGEKTRCEVYSRVVGYLRPVDQWNPGKQEEFSDRSNYGKVTPKVAHKD